MKKVYKYLLPVLVLLSGIVSELSAQTTTFAYTGSIATYTVPAGVTRLALSAKGAQGGQTISYAGGQGAIMTGTFTAVPGHILKIITGGKPSSTYNYCGGGGGGSYIWDQSAGNVLLIAAGGGGGAGYSAVGQAAVTTANGTNGGGGVTYGGAGTAGNGGTIPTYMYRGGGGAGWLSNGAAGTYPPCGIFAGGGLKPLSGGTGGAYGGNVSYVDAGGFGGGGGGQGNCFEGWGGGGGGYSGGGGGAAAAWTGGGGGGSFNSGAPQVNSVGNTGNGVVTITPLCAPPVGGAITGPDSVCIGAVATLQDTTATLPSMFGTANWTSNNPLLALIDPVTGIVTGVNAGVDTITYTIALTCGTVAVTRAITVNPLPDPVIGYSSTCPGSHITLTDSSGGGVWSSISPAVGTIDSTTGVFHGITAGITTVSYTLTSTGCASSRVVTVGSISGLPQVCMGDSVLISSTATGGTWSSTDLAHGTIDAAGEFTGTGMGWDTVVYTLASGCTLTYTMSINPLAPIAGIDSVCVGSNRYLTDIVGGGTWVSSTPSVATITSDSGRVFGLVTGSTVISYTLPVTGCMSTATFNVVSYPPAVLGILTACPGTTTTLVNATAGGWWTSADTGVAVVDPATGIVTGVANDTVDIYYTVSPGCSVEATVTINPLPAPVLGRGVVCPYGKDTLTDASPYGLWSSITPAVATVDTYGVVTAITGGNAIIRYTLPVTGCYQSEVVTVDPLPAPTITYNWLYATLYATPGYASYQWYDSAQGKIPGATTASIAAAATGYYYVVVTDSNGCKGASSVYYYNITQVGVHNVINANGILIYPNPTSGLLHIDAGQKVRVVISDLQGRTELVRDDAQELDISALSEGMYFVSVYDENGTKLTVQKLIKQ